MGRKRVWANDAERQRARRLRQAEGGDRDVRIRLSADAAAALDALMQRQQLTAGAVIDGLLLGPAATQRGARKPKKKTPGPPGDQSQIPLLDG